MSPCRTLQWRKPGALDPGAGEQQHVERQVDAEPALQGRAEHFQDAAGAGAEIEQRTERPVGQRVADRALDRLVGDMELADAVPLRGVGAEIVLRRRGPRGAHRREPVAVARDHRVLRVELRDQGAGELGRAAGFGQPEERPGALAEALDQPGLDQKLEMARDARLRLPQDLGQVGHRQLGLAEQHQDAQARFLAGRLEGRVEGVEWQVGRNAHGKWPIT